MDYVRRHGGEKRAEMEVTEKEQAWSRLIFKWLQILTLSGSNNTCEADF